MNVQDLRFGIIGGCVILERKRLGFAEAQKPWATFYNGPIFSPALSAQDTHAALGALLHHPHSTYDAVRLVLPPDFPYDIGHEEPSWNTSRDNSYLVDLTDMEALWKRLNRRARQRVRKASHAENSTPFFAACANQNQ